MPQHGFARINVWTLESSEVKSDGASVVFVLKANEQTLKLWPHSFYLEYKLQLSSTGLVCSLLMHNIDSNPFECHSLLHTYLRCDTDIHDLVVDGFQDVQYIDKLVNNETLTQPKDPITITREVDRVYINAINNIKLLSSKHNKVYLEITKTATLENKSTHETVPIEADCVLWNPWIDKSKGLADLDDEGYLSFVCVEPGTVAKLVQVPPNSVLTLTQTLAPS